MRAHLEIDDLVLKESRTLGGYTTIKSGVNTALAQHVKQLKRQALLKLRGQLNWQGDLEKLRGLRDTNID